ncbi:hypothetical protein BN381_90057 [Candidatus Microthrix parvicella RN1]|uniref:Uncharacterized protein n=1 Tax=Candidatus Neomicrothrix parvicella RN1 TaxID=1229780 RepID=R4Z781_9ACTN|nr:hypothetical protein BN381_90057 [Candidatus Microthrix parvicella RN1]
MAETPDQVRPQLHATLASALF